ncbi:MAG: UDP-glucose 4-epimerase GalE [Propylenella sp.]
MAAQSILVTGGAGYIGSHVVLELLAAGRRPVVLDDLSAGVRAAVPDDAPFHEGSVLDEALLGELFRRYRFEAVIHLAASVSVDESMTEPIKYYRNNALGTLTLAAAAVEAGVGHFIFSSSAAVYGVLESSPVREDAPKRPINPYGSSKLMGEEMLTDIAAARPGFRPVALRYFNVAGADPKGRAGERGAGVHLIRVAAETAVGARPAMNVYGADYPTRDGTAERDYVHVTDIAAAHVAALRYLEGGGEPIALNVGCGRGYTILEVLQALEKEIGRKLPVRMAPRRPGDPPSLVSDASRIREVFEWRPNHGELSEIISTALAWQKTLTAEAA